MERSRHVQLNKKQQVVRLSIPLSLAMVFVITLLWASMGSTPAIASSPVVSETTMLSNSNVITIGVAADLSGPADPIGWRQANAVQLAVNQTNAAGGVDIGGTSYSLIAVIADSACNGPQAVNAANTLLNAGAVSIVGHTCSGASIAAQPVYNAAGVPMVSASSTNEALTEDGYNTTFRVVSKDNAATVLMATHFHQLLGMDSVALVEWSGLEGSSGVFSNTFTSLGGNITSRRTINSTDEYTTTLTAVQDENPDAIYYADFDANNAGFLSSVAHKLGLSIIGWNAFDNVAGLGQYETAAGVAAEGDYAGLSTRRTQDMPGYDTLNADYQAAGFPNYGDEAQKWGAFAYDAAMIIIAAIDRAESADPMAIRDEIATTTNYAGVVGTYEGFDAKGDVIPQWSWLELYQNGEWVMVHTNKVFLPLLLNNFQ